MYLPVESALMAWWLGTSKTDAGTAKIIKKTPSLAISGVGGAQGCVIFSD